MVTLDSHGRSRYSAARKSHRLPVTDTERTNRARFVSVEMCLETCRTEFVASDLGIEPGVAFADVCSALTFTQPHEVFWKLYCCDSSRCRVHIDGGGPLEQSPNVDLLIHQCRDHGFYNIYDPGPPAAPCGKPSSFVLPAQPGPVSSSSIPSLPSSTRKESPAPAKPTSLDSATVTASTGATASYAPVVAAQNVPSSPGGLSQGAKAAIGICCVLAIMVLLMGLWLIRRRRRSNRGYRKSPPSPGHHHPRTQPGPQSGSHSPLLTPPPSSSSKFMPVTPPPPRLSDRRYRVSTTLDPEPVPYGRGSSPAATTAFPRASVFSPTGKKLAPRPEHPPTTSASGNNGILLSDPTAPPVLPLTRAPRGSPPNGQDSRTTGASPPAGEGTNPRARDFARPPGTPASSPSRPRRPHDELLDVGTVRPAGPPSGRSLPAPPRSVRHTRAPASSVLAVSPLSTAGSARLPTPSSPPAAAPPPHGGGTRATPEQEEENPPTAQGARPGPSTDSRGFTESYARKKRDTSVSWGSWGGHGRVQPVGGRRQKAPRRRG